MQRLDELNLPAHRTFDVIGKIVDMIAAYAGPKFEPRISRTPLKNGIVLHLIEPPVGSDIWIMEREKELLFIDTGFACYSDEMRAILLKLFPDFDSRERRCIITHPDMDHCGLLWMFDQVYVSRRAWEHFRLENDGLPNFREQHPAHAPYCAIARIASKYIPPQMETLHVIESNIDAADLPIFPIGHVDFGGLRLTIYRGNGGHAEGEVLIVDEVDKIVFCGDILVNPRGFTKPQDAYNRLAPYLMSSVNVDSARATQERNYMMILFAPEEYAYACGHGALLHPGERAR
jgi:glyoxylase-like metal-dependent hydrolase (beta-lactamase superfamily II)